MSYTEEARTFEEQLEQKGYLVMTCTGGSMRPLIRPRKDIAEICPVQRRAEKYEIVLYRRGDRYVLHRCTAVLPGGRYRFAGDHNDREETDVTDEMILGVMTRLIRSGKEIRMQSLPCRLYGRLRADFLPVRRLLRKAKGSLRRAAERIGPGNGRKRENSAE